MTNEPISPELYLLAQRVAKVELSLELNERVARLEERQIASDKAIPLVAEPIKVEARLLASKVNVLETAKNESTGKSSGFTMSWGIIVTVVGVVLVVAGLLLNAFKGTGH